MQIFIKTTDRTFVFDVENSTTVGSLREMIMNKTGYPDHVYYLIANGKTLGIREFSMSDYLITQDTTVTVMFRFGSA